MPDYRESEKRMRRTCTRAILCAAASCIAADAAATLMVAARVPLLLYLVPGAWVIATAALSILVQHRALERHKRFCAASASADDDAPSTSGDNDDDYRDGEDDRCCTVCGGDRWTECDDPIQCCDHRCDGEFHPCPACSGTGLAAHQVIWLPPQGPVPFT